MFQTIKKILLGIVDDIDAGNTNADEEELLEIAKVLKEMVRKDVPMSKYQAYTYLNMSRAKFDNLVREGKIPNKKKLNAWSKDQCDNFLRDNGVSVKNTMGYDSAYVLNMARSDYFGSSIVEDARLALYVRDYMDDVDGNPTRAFDEFYINCVAKGIPIFWGDML